MARKREEPETGGPSGYVEPREIDDPDHKDAGQLYVEVHEDHLPAPAPEPPVE